ncbi:hypothetical protein LUZ60_010822 [Juncus effusus]|nr:hypothetical protein LUZ60_010822 [Juncus effusus]
MSTNSNDSPPLDDSPPSVNNTRCALAAKGGESYICMSDDHWKDAADGITLIIATSLLVGLLLAVTRNRLWFRLEIFKLILGFVSNPLYTWMCQCTLLVLQIPYNNQFYIAWIVLFFIQFGTFYSLLGYVSEDGKEKRKEVKFREKLNFTSSINILWVLLFIPIEHRYLVPFFVLWALSILKIGQRYWSFDSSDRMYGTANTKLIALYMETECKGNHDYDPSTMRGYKYLVHGEEEIELHPSNYVARVKMTNDVTTINEVWNCQGNLLRNPGEVSDRLKDICLSFAWFKLLKRRMEGYPAAESKEPKTRSLVLELLSKGEERVFRVIKSELGFLSDLMHARQPVVFGIWLVNYNILVFCIVGVTLWIILKIHKDEPSGNDQSKIDPALTEVLVCFVLLTELWGLTSTFCSHWAKAIIISKYVKYHNIIDFMRFDKLLRLAWFGSFSRAICNFIPQYSLLNNFSVPLSSRLWCCLSCSLGGKIVRTGKKRSRSVKLSIDMKRVVCRYMKNLFEDPNPTLTNGSSTLLKHGMGEVLGWACGNGAIKHEHTHVDTIFIWHIATSFCQMELERRKEQTNAELESCKNVAVTISNYCAFLFALEPELLPIDSCTNEILFKKILTETRTFFGNCGKSKRYKKMVENDISGNTIIKNGVRLGRQLIKEITNDLQRWKLLEEFWAELIVFLAPSKNYKNHEQKLAEGGEFITFIWVLLYHAGNVKRPSKKAAHDEMLLP